MKKNTKIARYLKKLKMGSAMSIKYITLSFVLVSLLSISIGYWYSRHVIHNDFQCQSDVNILKYDINGNLGELRLTTFLIFSYPDSVTVIHKGTYSYLGKLWDVDRNITLRIKKLKGSNLFYIAGEKVTKASDDIATSDLVSSFLLDGVNYFNIVNLKDNTILINDFILPVLTCVKVE
ncbi:hypothetical protein RE070_004419 [Klebsiella aerogenes]|nr:hypothetical protein [Klebsiella aerogenes]ELA2606814.1 hypothetical protein [Klebsiella aerogenes]EMC9823456.1 hypothetical protein [Klebsiella aerogenes]HEO1674989.1 hypothetical protein [Klebsiella aerogenes]